MIAVSIKAGGGWEGERSRTRGAAGGRCDGDE